MPKVTVPLHCQIARFAYRMRRRQGHIGTSHSSSYARPLAGRRRAKKACLRFAYLCKIARYQDAP